MQNKNIYVMKKRVDAKDRWPALPDLFACLFPFTVFRSRSN